MARTIIPDLSAMQRRESYAARVRKICSMTLPDGRRPGDLSGPYPMRLRLLEEGAPVTQADAGGLDAPPAGRRPQFEDLGSVHRTIQHRTDVQGDPFCVAPRTRSARRGALSAMLGHASDSVSREVERRTRCSEWGKQRLIEYDEQRCLDWSGGDDFGRTYWRNIRVGTCWILECSANNYDHPSAFRCRDPRIDFDHFGCFQKRDRR